MKLPARYEVLLVLIIIIVTAFNLKLAQTVRKERDGALKDRETLLVGIKNFKVRDSLNAVEVGKLVETQKELKQTNSQILKLCNDLNIKLKRVQTLSTIGTATDVTVKVPVHDTVVDTTRCRSFKKETSNFNLSGVLCSDTVEVNLVVYDTLQQIVYRVPKQFMFIKYGTIS